MFQRMKWWLNRKDAYRAVFKGPMGMAVIADLARLTKHTKRIHGERECGHRDVFIHILGMLDLSENDIRRSIQQHNQEDVD